MAYPAVNEFKRLSAKKKVYSRTQYSLNNAKLKIQKLIGDRKVELPTLLEHKENHLTSPRARKELTDVLYNILIDHGIDINGIDSVQEAAERLYAEIFGYSVLQPFMDDPKYNEVYFNHPSDVKGIIGLERVSLPVKFDSEDHALEMLQRLTEKNSREGKAAHDNRINSTVLPDRTRLRWALPPISDGIAANLRKHSLEDMKKITPEKYISDGVMTEQVFSLLVGMALTGVCYGILGPGGVGKTALLRVILKEVHVQLSPRFLVSENGSELYLRYYLEQLGCENVDVHSQQKWSGSNESLSHIFANFMQAKGEVIVQPEVLMPEEVNNILMAKRRGHTMGPFTIHSFPHNFIDALSDLYLMANPSTDREAIKRSLTRDVIASCHYDIQHTPFGKQRRIIGVYQNLESETKPILELSPNGEYVAFPIENMELRDRLHRLKFISPKIYKEVQKLL